MKFGKVLGKSEEALSLNRKLEELKTRLVNQYDHLMKTDGFATAEKLKNSFLGIGTMDDSLLKVFQNFNADFEKMVQKGVRGKQTLAKYQSVYAHLLDFMNYKYYRTDMAFRELTADFIKDFDFYLRVDKGLTHNTIWVYMMPLRKMIDIALEKDLIHKNPFREYEITMQEKDRGYLLKEEIEQLLSCTFRSKPVS